MSGILKAIRRMFRGNKHDKPSEFSKKTDNFTSYVEEYGTSVNSEDVSDGCSNFSFASPLKPQDSTYDIPSSVYQIPHFCRESVTSLPNIIALDNAEKGSQEPIYATIRKTKDMASQTDLSTSSSENFSSLMSSSSGPSISSPLARTILPPPPLPVLTGKKASDFQPVNVLNSSPLKHTTQSTARLQSASIVDELKFNRPTLKSVKVAPNPKPELTEVQKKFQQIKKKIDEGWKPCEL